MRNLLSLTTKERSYQESLQTELRRLRTILKYSEDPEQQAALKISIESLEKKLSTGGLGVKGRVGDMIGENMTSKVIDTRERHGANKGQVIFRDMDIYRDMIYRDHTGFKRKAPVRVGKAEWNVTSGEWKITDYDGKVVGRARTLSKAKDIVRKTQFPKPSWAR